jgi:hypothetical protein
MRNSLRRLERYAKSRIRRFGVLVLGGALLAVGVGFLLAALWMVLAAQFSPMAATFIYAALFLGAGLMSLYLVPRQDDLEAPAAQKEQRNKAKARGNSEEGQSLIDAFLLGADLYARLRERSAPREDRRTRR